MLAKWHWHVEISSKCTLKCPRCSRQEVPKGLVNTELDLAFFQRNFTPEFVQNNVEKITFCGDDGDPIYAHDLIPVIRYLKSIKPVDIVIVTNGSYKSRAWWQELGSLLSAKDSVHFSVDGYDQNSNNIYRVNSDWDSIMTGIKTLRTFSPCFITWAAIAFNFNQDHLGDMQSQAEVLGVDIFQITRSTKFGRIYPIYGENDPLEPTPEWISSSMRFEREIHNLSGRTQVPNNQTVIKLYHSAKEAYTEEVVPLCAIGNKGMFINSQGDFFPCCWVANRYGHNQEWLDRAKTFNLKDRTIEDVLSDTYWTTEFRQFAWLECKTKCHRERVNLDYATSW